MTQVTDESPNTAVRHRSLLAAEPSLYPALFSLSRGRMHLIGMALAHIEGEQLTLDLGPLLLRGPLRQILTEAFLPKWTSECGDEVPEEYA